MTLSSSESISSSSNPEVSTLLQHIRQESQALQRDIESRGKRSDEKRYIRGDILPIPNDQFERVETEYGFDISSWGERTSLVYDPEHKTCRIVGIDFVFRFDDDFEPSLSGAQFSKQSGEEVDSSVPSFMGRMIGFANVLNYIQWHAQGLIARRNSQDFSLSFAEKIRERFGSHTGIVYHFKDAKEDIVKTYIRFDASSNSANRPSHFAFYCPTQDQRQAVLDFLNHQVSVWRETVDWSE